MGLYIKGMSKPKNCRGCYFNGSNLSCLITRGRIDRDDYTCEIECPIVEVKTPHGPLKDTDEMLTFAKEGAKEGVGYPLEAVGCFKTVIEAEVE